MRCFLLSLGLLLCASCSQSMALESVADESKGLITVEVSMPCATNSRIAIDDDGKGGYQVAWREGDKIGAWFNSEQGADSFGEFTMKHFDAVASTFIELYLLLAVRVLSIRLMMPLFIAMPRIARAYLIYR